MTLMTINALQTDKISFEHHETIIEHPFLAFSRLVFAISEQRSNRHLRASIEP